jgi:hypothetical protein
MGRPIDYIGAAMKIGAEGPWSSGESGSSYLRLIVSDEQGGKLWTAHNRSPRCYLAVSFDVTVGGKKAGETWDVIPPASASRLWWFFGDEPGYLKETFCVLDPE